MMDETRDVALRERTTISENLRVRKRALESELADVNAALEALESNPEVMRVARGRF